MSLGATPAPTAPAESASDAAIAKAARRLIPFLVAGFFVAYLDRVNLGFAALTMNKDLALSPAAFGWGAGVFFFGYALFEAPSNYILHHVGARRWLARIMVSWGLVSAGMAFVHDESSFVALRLLLGVTEAGFSPGVLLYLTYWFPAVQRGRIFGLFLIAVPLSTAFGAPVSGAILTYMNGLFGLAGWQWLFIVEAAPATLLGVVAWFFLTDRPEHADWLEPNERAALVARMADEAGEEDHHILPALREPRNLLLGIAYFGIVLALYGLGVWLPQIAAGFGYAPMGAALLTAVPFIIGAGAMMVWGRRSDRGAPARDAALAAIAGSVGLTISAFCTTPAAAIAAMSLGAAGTLAAMPAFWNHVARGVTGARAAVTIALVNSIGNLAGFAGPYLVGWVKETTGLWFAALLTLAAGPALCAAIMATVDRRERRPSIFDVDGLMRENSNLDRSRETL